MSNLITTQINQLAERFDLPQSEELYQVLKSTAFKGEVSDAQLSALLIVSKQYGLNPWTKEIYAFPDKGGIVPVVGIDGWSRIINSNPQFDGMDFEQDAESCTCTIYRKDRAHPIKLTEWMDECKRPNVGPWQSHPYRMLRHKAMIQCARVAFGFGGIYDQDEAERIIEAKPAKDMGMVEEVTPKTLPAYPADKFAANLPAWLKFIAEGKATAEKIIAKLRTVGTLTPEQIAAIEAIEAKPAAPVVTFAQVANAMNKANNAADLDAAADLIGEVDDGLHRAELSAKYEARKAELEGAAA